MLQKRIIVASGNTHKIEEIKSILKGLPVEVLSKNEVGLKELEVVEDRETLEENAIKKAKEISEKTEGIVLADDTGLFVDKLNGEPGIYSARYAGEDATYLENNKKLLKELEDTKLEQRTAEFRTVIAIVLEDKSIKTLTGICKGRIALEPKGDKGFGYDPLFIVDGYDKTFAQLGEDIKNKISHRARALEELRKELEDILKDE
ncbi:XTP/dITP diphosphatase [Clostridium sp. D2Q-11]|uniref:dITP/XTP pyrophosphatase n=1 Tax=Anaeromonas frigoriresistens TaxID=2683708 RepID=A0A942UU37_9FIRM|nr:XTP/dITP diphosphatase [Anaeromonas frigoriresistens]MBS4538020.1 XTP/dITP diphosphatase [Anaeromonas frigoriresistens]